MLMVDHKKLKIHECWGNTVPIDKRKVLEEVLTDIFVGDTKSEVSKRVRKREASIVIKLIMEHYYKTRRNALEEEDFADVMAKLVQTPKESQEKLFTSLFPPVRLSRHAFFPFSVFPGFGKFC